MNRPIDIAGMETTYADIRAHGFDFLMAIWKGFKYISLRARSPRSPKFEELNNFLRAAD